MLNKSEPLETYPSDGFRFQQENYPSYGFRVEPIGIKPGVVPTQGVVPTRVTHSRDGWNQF